MVPCFLVVPCTFLGEVYWQYTGGIEDVRINFAVIARESV